MINFALCFTIGKAHGWGTFQKCRPGLNYHLFLGPFVLRIPSVIGLYPTLILCKKRKKEAWGDFWPCN
jgi:hypothetical protein